MGEQWVPDNPQRIVVLDYATADNLLLLGEGAKSKIVAMSRSQYAPPHIQQGFAEIPSLGSLRKFDLEQVAAYKPDLIIVGTIGADKITKLKQIAPVYHNDIQYQQNPTPYKDIKTNAFNLAKILNASSQQLAKLEQSASRIEQKMAKLRAQVNNRTASFIIVSDRQLIATGIGGRYGIVFSDFGFKMGEKLANDGLFGMQVNYEYLEKVNPDYILGMDRTSALDQATAGKNIFGNKLISSLKAGQHNAIGTLNAKYWYITFGGLNNTEIILDDLLSVVQNSTYPK